MAAWPSVLQHAVPRRLAAQPAGAVFPFPFRHRHRPVCQLPGMRAFMQGAVHLDGRPCCRRVALRGMLRLHQCVPGRCHQLHHKAQTPLHTHDAACTDRSEFGAVFSRRDRPRREKQRKRMHPRGATAKHLRGRENKNRPASIPGHRPDRSGIPGPDSHRRLRRNGR